METPKHCYGKIQDIINDSECLIQSIPIAIGGPHRRDCAASSFKTLMKYTTLKVIDISTSNNFYSNIIDKNEYPIKQKIILSDCMRIQPFHLILFFDPMDNAYKLRTFAECYINGTVYTSNSTVQVHSYDNIAINCQECRSDHIYLLTLSHHSHDAPFQATQILNPFGDSNMNVGLPEIVQSDSARKFVGLKEPAKKPDEALARRWTSCERECLLKYLVTFGYDRWDAIKDNSDKLLNDKKDLELKVFSLAFIKRIIELLPQHNKGELMGFLVDFIHDNENEDEPFIDHQSQDWGTLIKSRATAWGKRIRFLHKVKVIVEKFAKENKKSNDLRKALNNDNLDTSQKEHVNNHINWNNLLDFLPDSALCGDKPATWWTRSHDVDLLRGTYKHGYANYASMKQDKALSFWKSQDWPTPNSITRRFIRLMQIIIRKEKENDDSEQENPHKETSGFSPEEKGKIISYLINYGIPINANNGNSDWSALKTKLTDKKIIPKDNNEGRTISTQTLKVFVQTLQNSLKEQMKDHTYGETDYTASSTQLNTGDDKFPLTFERANVLITRLTQMEFFRQHMHNINIVSEKSLFDQGVEELTELTKAGESEPKKCKETFWKCDIHDRHLLAFIVEHGFVCINDNINHHHDFQRIHFTTDDYLTRVDFLYQFYSKLKHPREPHQPVRPRKREEIYIRSGKKEIKVERDENNNFIYPIEVSPSLSILNLGKIEYKRVQYHSKKNLFPIGYTVQREARSMYRKKEKAKYICEILENGEKPKYRITCTENKEEIIERNTSTACWVAVTTRIKELERKLKKKVTISGPDRFGLSDPIVVQLLQMLPGADKCEKYIFKEEPFK